MKRALFAVLLLAFAAELPLACSTNVPLAQKNAKCEYDEQCAQGLACKCVRRRNPDDEGPDEILAPGVCQTQDYRCAGDAGTTDTAVVDTGAVVDSAPPDTTTTTTTDAADGG